MSEMVFCLFSLHQLTLISILGTLAAAHPAIRENPTATGIENRMVNYEEKENVKRIQEWRKIKRG